MPLDAQHEPVVRRLDRFGQVVEGRMPAHLEPFPEHRDPLVVMGLGHMHLLAGGPGRERSSR